MEADDPTAAAAATDLRFRGEALQRLDAGAVIRAGEDLRTWVGLGGHALPRSGSVWAPALGVVRDGPGAQAAMAAAADAAGAITTFDRVLDEACAATGLPAPITVTEATAIAQLLVDVAETERRFGSGVWQHDLGALAAAMAPATKGGVARWIATMFDGGWRRARATVRTLESSAMAAGGASAGGGNDTDRLAAAEIGARVHSAWRSTGAPSDTPRPPSDPSALSTAGARAHTTSTDLLAWFPSLTPAGVAMWSRAQRIAWIAGLVADQSTLATLPELHRTGEALRALDLSPLLDLLSTSQAEATSAGLDPGHARRVLDHVWLASILDHIVLSDPRIGAFDGPLHDQAVAAFRDADRRHLEAAVALVRRKVAERSVKARDEFPDQEPDRRAPRPRARGAMCPLRDLFAAAPDVLTASSRAG